MKFTFSYADIFFKLVPNMGDKDLIGFIFWHISALISLHIFHLEEMISFDILNINFESNESHDLKIAKILLMRVNDQIFLIFKIDWK